MGDAGGAKNLSVIFSSKTAKTLNVNPGHFRVKKMKCFGICV